ncbi:MAG: hypothetical protein H6813_07470 [Phycisphaeraceae bacterium]|nr:hypothetical protein [Phycisphaeraceae bacterium]MCB9848334.1 hypothetical protein [Phycisphaeraceae bacterium]
MGKTLTVLNYTVAAILLFLAVGLGWVASHLHARGYADFGIPPGWSAEAVQFCVLAALMFMVFVVCLVGPSFRVDRAPYQHGTPEYQERLNRSWQQSFDCKWRRRAMRHAPRSMRWWIRITTWGPFVFLGLMLVISAGSRVLPLPSWMGSVLKFIFGSQGPYNSFVIVLVIFIPAGIAQFILEHRVHKAYERIEKRALANAAHCPECDYPIDRKGGMRVCPECGCELIVTV